ncbi:hypothetical protein FGADI_1730 [Fusarium gaditjirri]|uniref:Uncharacterized protein n=1 Tax=Fusarium gaditjirri TaxID=282569 RepID=A0A8H4TK22_9HYPO|nr:hypothetical protein FGADI_1730 [Fusarium gaditjirri]
MGSKQYLRTTTSPVIVLQYDEMSASWSNWPALATLDPMPDDRNLSRQGQPSSMPHEIGDSMVSFGVSAALAYNGSLVLGPWSLPLTPQLELGPPPVGKAVFNLIPMSIPTGCKEARNRSRGLKQ